MPPDSTVPRTTGDAPPSSRNALRGGVLAALSTAPAAAASSPAQATGPNALAAAAPGGHAPPPPRGLAGSLRAAARRGLLFVRPLAVPFLHRLQMRMRTAVNESDVAARMAGVEQALARLSERFEAEAAASRRGVEWVAAENARRLEAARAESSELLVALRREAGENARRLDAAAAQYQEAVSRRQDAAQEQLEALGRAVADVTAVVQARAGRRAPILLGDEFMAWTPDGCLLLPAEDLRLVAAMSQSGVLEHGTRRVLEALLRPGGAFLDVGAHVGTMTLLGADRVGEHGRVFAVEPLPRLAALVRRSMALNDFAERVLVAACAAGEAEAEGVLHIGEVMGHSSLLPLPDASPGAATARVPIRPVDGIVPAGTPIDVAKIDAEGTELQVWRGMRRVVGESPDLAVVLEFGPSHLARAGITPEAWLGELESAGFESFAIDEATAACRPAKAATLAERFSTNVLLLRPGAASRHPELVFA